jgi:hypothetical protein
VKDETLREALRTAAKHEPATGDPFSRFEAVRRRNSFARGLIVAGIGALLILSFAFVFPNPLRSGLPADYNIGGELEPLPNTVKIYEDPIAGFRLRYPARWRARGAPGSTVAFFIDTPSIRDTDPHTDLFKAAEGFTLEVPTTFYIEVTPLMSGIESPAIHRDELDLLHDLGAIITQQEIVPQTRGQSRIDQLRAFFGERPIGKGVKRISYWCQNCRLIELTVVLAPRRGVPPLHVRVVAPSQQSYNENLFELLPILDSVERLILLGTD